MVKLCLGSANFGTRYGLANKKINKSNLLPIFNEVSKNKIDTIDTSFEYFDSHQQIKKALAEKMKINTKIFLDNNSSFTSLKKKIDDFNKSSPSIIDCLMFHDQTDGLNIKFIKILKKLKDKNIVKKIGVSVYDYDVLKNILKLWTPDVIQIPVNPFNRDFIKKNLLKNLKKKKITIYARSIFLQGLLVNESYCSNFQFHKELNNWFEFCRLKSLHPVKLCIDFCKSINEIDYLIFGVQKVEELKEIIKFFNQPSKNYNDLIFKKNYTKIDLRNI